MLEKKLDFSYALKLALAFGLVVISLLLFFIIKDILITFLVAIIFAIALDKPIDKLVEKKISRGLAVAFIYTILLVIIGLIFYSLLPPLAQEINNFVTNLPTYLELFFEPSIVAPLSNSASLTLTQYLKTFSGIIGTDSQEILGKIFTVFGGFLSFLIVFFVALFLNIQKNGVRHLVFLLVPKKHLDYANKFFNKTQDNVNNWLWGKLLSSLVVSIIIYLGLTLLNIPYALVLSVLALILNFIPFVGPFIAAIFPTLLGFTISIPYGLAVIGLYFFANSIFESFILLPIFMKKTINMNPALIILFVLIGGRLAGVLGIIISIPIAAIASLIVREYLASKNISSIDK